MRLLTPGSSGGNGSLPFISEAYANGLIKEGEVLEITEVKMTQAKSGYLLRTEMCVILLYKSSPWIDVLEATLEELLSQNPSYVFCAVVNSDQPQGIELAVDEEVGRIWTKSKKFAAGIVYVSNTLETPVASFSRKARRLKNQGQDA